MSLFKKQREQINLIIVETSILLFREKRYDKVTIDEITKKVGIGKGTFYNYFSSKQEVLLYWFEQKFEKLDLESMADCEKSIRENLFELIHNLILAFDEGQDLLLSFLKEMMNAHTENRLNGRFVLRNTIKKVVANSKDYYRMENSNVDLKIKILNSALFLPMLNWVYSGNYIDGLEDEMKKIVDICLDGMLKVPE